MSYKPNAALLALWFEDFETQGHFAGKRIEITDPDEPRHRQVYEDLGEINRRQRRCLVTIYPEHAKSAARGDDLDGLIVIEHDAALLDIRKMLAQGYVLTMIDRDILN